MSAGIVTLSFNPSRQALVSCAYAGVTALMYGSPGVGKTTLVGSLKRAMRFARSLGIPVHKLSVRSATAEEARSADAERPVHTLIASTCDSTDIGGIIVVVDGRPLRFPLAPIMACVENPGILFLDEFTTVPPSVQAPLLRLILDYVAGEFQLHPQSWICAAANDPDECPGGQVLSAATVNRLCIWKLEPTVDEVRAFMRGQAEDPVFDIPDVAELDALCAQEMLAYEATMAVEPRLWSASPPPASRDAGAPWASSRSIVRGIRAYCASVLIGADREVQHAVFAGCTGEDAATTYLALRDMRGKLPTPEAIKLDPEHAPMPEGDQNLRYAMIGVLGMAAAQDTWATWIYANRATDPDFRQIVARNLLTSYPIGKETGDKARATKGAQARQKMYAEAHKNMR